MTDGSTVLSPFGSNCCGLYVYALLSVAVVALVFVTVTLTRPGACAGVLHLMVVAFWTTTLVAAAPPKVTVAPVLKPVPVTVTGWPPKNGPLGGVTLVTVIGETVTFADFASEQPAPVVTVTLRVSVPTTPAVNVMLFVPVPAVMVPLVMLQA